MHGDFVDERKSSTWDDFVGALAEFETDWVFRGQMDARWELRTTLERYTPSEPKRSKAERYLLEEFKRRAHTYLGSNLIPTEDSEWLALMQHYGAPTRLLDTTRSPFVAAYFAVEDVIDGSEACAVWGVHRSWCIRAAGAVKVASAPADLRRVLESEFAPPLEIIAGVAQVQTTAEKWFETAVRMVWPFEPYRLTERLSIQQGEFLVPGDVDISFMDNLRALGDLKNSVVKFVIDLNERGRALEQLRLVNITRASLFPGLEGYTQSFRQMLIREPDESRKRRYAIGGLKRARRSGWPNSVERASDQEPQSGDSREKGGA